MSKSVTEQWHVYVLRCADMTLYTGVTTDVQRRVFEHNEAKLGAKYTKARRPVMLLYSESANNRSEAQKREAEVKKMSRAEKLQLVKKT